MKGRSIPYSVEEMTWLDANHKMAIGDYHQAFCAAFGRADVSAVNLHSLRKRSGWRTGRTGCFNKGNEPHNKGVPCAPNTGGHHPNAQKTQFKGGSRTGKAAENYRPIGTERVSVDGYRERKIHDGMPMQSRWQLVQRIEWEAENGPVPEGHCLKCLDGDRLNTNPANWEMIPRGVLARLNGGRFKKRIAYDDAPGELKPAVMAVAKIEHLTHTRKRIARSCTSRDGEKAGKQVEGESA